MFAFLSHAYYLLREDSPPPTTTESADDDYHVLFEKSWCSLLVFSRFLSPGRVTGEYCRRHEEILHSATRLKEHRYYY